MSAFVLVAGQNPKMTPEMFDAFAYGNRVAVLPLKVTYFDCPVQVWEMPSRGDAEAQADRLASGWFVALPFDTLAGVQARVNDWAVSARID